MSDQDLQDQPAHLQKVPSLGCEGEVLGHEVTFEAEDDHGVQHVHGTRGLLPKPIV